MAIVINFIAFQILSKFDTYLLIHTHHDECNPNESKCLWIIIVLEFTINQINVLAKTISPFEKMISMN